ncbi:DUF4258 domain-containing protein [Candidatus Woesearchaeota archaeon]|nr:DUF4258 domain-containing protein [Candidatus Woesearchaeota archaeon]
MIISDHARDEMAQEGITEDDVRNCLTHGELEIKQIVDGETRYGKQIDLKNKTIMIIFTIRNKEERIITAYAIRRKKWQKN